MLQYKKLDKKDNGYTINSKVPFKSRTTSYLTEQDLANAITFSFNMTFGNKGEHRASRTGGSITRSLDQQFNDILIGKLGEIAFYNVSKDREGVLEVTDIDYACYELGKWDCSDFVINNIQQIAVKTTKHFGNLLLLEKGDWFVSDKKAYYKPNLETPNEGIYDYMFFSRVKIAHERYISDKNFTDVQVDDLLKTLTVADIELEVVGYVSNRTLVYVIENEFILPKGSILNGRTVMDADNYYLQSGFFKEYK